LEKDFVLKNYFDNWGSRCYAFSSELGGNFMLSKYSKKTIHNLDFDIDVFKEMGGKFIISAVRINTLKNERYNLLKTFTDENSFWKIYLYAVS
jgi:hypothetical protein